MFPEKIDTFDLSKLITKDLRVDHNEVEISEETNANDLHAQLTKLIRHMLDADFQYLMNAMYRIDISENALNSALNTPNPEHVASEIAHLVIQREIQKLETRKKYSTGKPIF